MGIKWEEGKIVGLMDKRILYDEVIFFGKRIVYYKLFGLLKKYLLCISIIIYFRIGLRWLLKVNFL